MQPGTQEMLEAYCESRDPQLRNALAERYLYLAKAVARRFADRGAELEDLTQVASVALLSALERFDIDKGLAFTTFAVPTLAGVVRNYLRDKAKLMRLPRHGVELLTHIAQERERFTGEHGYEPSVTELAEALKVPMDDVLDALEMQRSTQAMSLDNAVSEDSPTLKDLLGRDEEAYARIESEDMVAHMLSMLEGTSRFVIEERFLRQRSQREVAKDLGVSQMQVSRMERRALEKLRAKMV